MPMVCYLLDVLVYQKLPYLMHMDMLTTWKQEKYKNFVFFVVPLSIAPLSSSLNNTEKISIVQAILPLFEKITAIREVVEKSRRFYFVNYYNFYCIFNQIVIKIPEFTSWLRAKIALILTVFRGYTYTFTLHDASYI